MPNSNNRNNDMYSSSGSSKPKISDLFKTNKQSTFDMFNIDVKKAQKDVKSIFGYAREQSKSYEKDSLASTKTMVSQTVSSYKGMYDTLGRLHSGYLTGVIRREQRAYLEVSKIWGRDIKQTRTVETVYADSDNSSDSTSLSSNLSGSIDNLTESINILSNKVGSSSANDKVENSRFIEEITDKSSSKSSKNIGKWASAAVALVSPLFNELKSAVVGGFSQNIENWNANYTELSGRLGANRSETSALWNNLGDFADSLGYNTLLDYNKELYPQLVTVVREGFQGQTAILKATDDAISSKLLPWLDTHSSAWQNMFANLDKNTLDTVKGMQLQLQNTQAGNRLLQSGVINTLTSSMEPLLRDISVSVDPQAQADIQNYAERLVATGEYTSDQALAAATRIVNVGKNQYGALTSGNTADAMTAIAMMNGEDPVKAIDQIHRMANSAGTNVGVGAVYSNLGLSIEEVGGAYTTSQARRNLNATTGYLRGEGPVDANTALDVFNNAEENADQRVTYQDQVLDYLKNISNDVSNFFKNVPFVGQIVSGITGAISTLFGGKFLGSVFNAIKGSKPVTNASGFFNNLRISADDLFASGATNGSRAGAWMKTLGNTAKSGVSKLGSFLTNPITLGVAGGAMALHDAVKGVGKADEWFGRAEGEATTGEKVASGIGGAIGGTGSGISDVLEGEASAGDVAKNALWNTGKGAAIGAAIGSIIPGVGTAIGGVVGGAAGLVSGLIGGEKISEGIKSIGDGIANVGKSIGETVTNSVESAKEFLNAPLEEKGEMITDAISNVGKSIANFFGIGMDEAEKELESENASANNQINNASSSSTADGSHAAGLNSVPYDGYQAILHKGEGIYNASANNAIQSILGVKPTSVSPLNSIGNVLTNAVKSISITGTDDSDGSKEIVDTLKWMMSQLNSLIKNNQIQQEREYVDRRNNTVRRSGGNYNDDIVNFVQVIPAQA